jgi:aspartate aminotransferase/aminotransferase
MDVGIDQHVHAYRRKRDMIVAGLSDVYELVEPGGAFYAFPKAPWGTGTEFVEEAGKENLLIIPGGIFSHRDTHFRLSYAAEDEVIERGIEVLRRLARK